MIDLLPFALLGAVIGLDVVSFPQAMFSRPIVAATLAGAMAGHPVAGLIAGATLELVAFEMLPVGASRYPEWGSAAVVGGALFAERPTELAGALTIAVLAAVTTAWLGGWSMHELRRLNAWWSHRLSDGVARGDRQAVVGLQLRGLTTDLVRGGVLTFLGLAVWQPIMNAGLERWSVAAGPSRAIIAGVAGASALAAAWTLTHGTTAARWFFVASVVAGLTIVGLGIR
jgi:PTS system mannose-specific IIC component